MLVEVEKISIYKIEMYAYMMKWNCAFIRWTLDSESEMSHLLVKKIRHLEWVVLYLVVKMSIQKRMVAQGIQK